MILISSFFTFAVLNEDLSFKVSISLNSSFKVFDLMPSKSTDCIIGFSITSIFSTSVSILMRISLKKPVLNNFFKIKFNEFSSKNFLSGSSEKTIIVSSDILELPSILILL